MGRERVQAERLWLSQHIHKPSFLDFHDLLTNSYLDKCITVYSLFAENL